MEAEKLTMAESTQGLAIDNAFLGKVLSPYRTHCCYLKKATFQQTDDTVQGLLMHGEFGIAESCYIDDTGHFNAVEYNICYNQIAYLHLGHCIQHGLIAELTGFVGETFFQKQLSNFLIARLTSGYQRQLNAKRFYGTFGIESLKKTARCTFINTYCHFHDDEKGKSTGEVTLAVLHP